MKRYTTYTVAILLLWACKATAPVSEESLTPEPQAFVFPADAINHSVRSLLNTQTTNDLQSIYTYSANNAIWLSDSAINKVLQWISEAPYHGLDAEDYQLTELFKKWNNISETDSDFVQKRAAFDLQLSKAVKQYGYNIRYGTLNPSDFYGTWNYHVPESINDSVWVSLARNKDIQALNTYFTPQHKLYQHIHNELKKRSSVAEREQHRIIDPGFLLRKGDSNKYVLPLKARLLPRDSTERSMAFDKALHKAVMKFQQKHGLKADGIVGKNTYYFLNWNKAKYQSVLKTNLEKLRWIPAHQLDNGMVVNIPSMQLELYKKDSLVFNTRVIVGKYANQTPVFQSKLDYVVFNPCWTVPNSIASKSMLPRLKKDSTYLQNRNMFITQNGKEVNSDDIDFSLYSINYFPFKIFQRTSPGNALGRVKFMFDNKYSIYLHDTPSKRLFSKDIRAFSHGCVRVENAVTMAAKVLHTIDEQTRPHNYYFKKGFPVKVYLDDPIPLSLVYFTCWYNPALKQLVFYKDVYGKDTKLAMAMTNHLKTK